MNYKLYAVEISDKNEYYMVQMPYKEYKAKELQKQLKQEMDSRFGKNNWRSKTSSGYGYSASLKSLSIRIATDSEILAYFPDTAKGVYHIPYVKVMYGSCKIRAASYEEALQKATSEKYHLYSHTDGTEYESERIPILLPEESADILYTLSHDLTYHKIERTSVSLKDMNGKSFKADIAALDRDFALTIIEEDGTKTEETVWRDELLACIYKRLQG